MSKSKRVNIKRISFLIFWLIILSPGFIYSISQNENSPLELIVGGELLQIDIKTSNLIFYAENDANSSIKKYDVVKQIEGSEIKRIFNKSILSEVERTDLFTLVKNIRKDETVTVTVLRNNDYKKINLCKRELKPSYFIEEVSFCASLTYINPKDNSFSAVAHNISISDNSNANLQNVGDVYLCDLCEIKKSNKYEVGNMYGNKIFGTQGKIYEISEFGIKGKIIDKEILRNREIYEVGKKEDVKIGMAQIIIKDNYDKESQLYDIEIIETSLSNESKSQRFEFIVIDDELIKKYGGIIQGMSGCPIIQNGKIIGALSHVITTDTKHGIGLYIEYMMED